MEHPALEEFRERVRGIGRREDFDKNTVAVLNAFESAGIQCLVLKGPALTRLLYTENEHRGYSDVDLLVAPRDLTRARRALVDLGCRGGSEKSGIDDVSGVLHSEGWMRLGDGGRSLPIDLHWRLAGLESPAQAVWDVLHAQRTWIDLGGRRVPVLDRPGLALHLATHSAQHGPCALKSMADLRRGIERWPLEVWRSAGRLAGETGGTMAFAAGLRLLPSGVALARELALPETDELNWEIMHRAARPRGTFHLQAWARARGARQRVDLLRRSLLPRSEWLGWEYAWARRGGVSLVAAYALHLMRTPLWAARAWRFRRRARRAAD